ncbi:hypothetical protein AC1031_016931 [Aphanomyces cochlioides]|nr:hypothetical protein AC1031_016931 [Aphanomyces cochlioides]
MKEYSFTCFPFSTASLSISLADVSLQLHKWLASPVGQSATRLQLVPIDADTNTSTLTRFQAALIPAEFALASDEPSVAAWTYLDTAQRITWLQQTIQQGRVHAVAGNSSRTSNVFLAAGSSAIAIYYSTTCNKGDAHCAMIKLTLEMYLLLFFYQNHQVIQ